MFKKAVYFISSFFEKLAIPNFIIMLITNHYFEMVEDHIALDWTIKYFCIPILLITAICRPIVGLKNEKKAKKIKEDFLTRIKSLGILCLEIVGIALFFSLGVNSLILMTNIFGELETKKVSGKIIYYESGKINDKIIVQDANDNKNIELSVDEKFAVGDSFSVELKSGSWGILYK